VRPELLAESLARLEEIVEIAENDRIWINTSPHGEPQLGRRGLYGGIGGVSAAPERLALLWVLNQSDGTHGLLDIAERSGLSFAEILAAAKALAGVGLLAPAS
jgi:aminopeptidase-like protein